MALLSNHVSTAKEVIALQPEELAGLMLESLAALPPSNGGAWCLNNFFIEARGEYEATPSPVLEELEASISTAWLWLAVNGLIWQKHDSNWYALSAKGKQAALEGGLQHLVASAQLPVDMLHPALVLRSRPHFLRSEFDVAVLTAFRAVEVALRDGAGLAATTVGKQLAFEAFKVEHGPLTNMSEPTAEREAIMQLMSGAIGRYKNPSSHRHVVYSVAEAREIIFLASHLLRVIDSARDRANCV